MYVRPVMHEKNLDREEETRYNGLKKCLIAGKFKSVIKEDEKGLKY